MVRRRIYDRVSRTLFKVVQRPYHKALVHLRQAPTLLKLAPFRGEGSLAAFSSQGEMEVKDKSKKSTDLIPPI
jgi:hypothetical protein